MSKSERITWGIPKRRKKQLMDEGTDCDKVESAAEEIFSKLCQDGFSISETKYLLTLMGWRLSELERRSPATKMSSII